ncbi:Transcription factor [Metarhizium rileyi]|uniref:Transcription factor n=1 Tax=Metarhizium rileyi (strain RCEF 4871) TaxID=1649241 RepID=A0A167I559_METRR|nr:Transcription factor [Metarhizium rileyi RCEF 4871]
MAAAVSTGVAVDDSSRETGYNRSACTECQRRKQKCNREWPCDRCQRRKIADECRYNYSNPTLDTPAHDLAEKLKRTHDDYTNRGTVEADDGDGAGFDALATRLYATLGIDHGVSEKPTPKQDMVDADSSPQMRRVLQLLPQRQSMGKSLLYQLPRGWFLPPIPNILMQNFLGDINYHYYIIYPPVFLQDYHIWWDRRSENRPLSLQYTCLLAIICACALQHVEDATERALERELGDTMDVVSDRLHAAMRELASVIPVGHYHYLNVQRLLHSCYWYKAEAKFLEAWHVLSAAILEANELGYHKEPTPGTVTEFDLEMRRRLWCILDTWDWQISSGLSRPKIIHRADCDTELPELTLEGHIVSPLQHMKMQSGLTRRLASRFSAPKNIISPEEVQEYKVIIEDWVNQFPPEYAFDNPDTSKDQKCSWLFAHRFYVYTMACLLILNPIRHYMVKQYTWKSDPEELDIRTVGVWYSLKLMKTLRRWVDKIYNRDGRLHFIIFSIFDTAAILCTAILKDAEYTISNRVDVLASIGDAVDMLKKLNTISKTSKTSYDILERLVRRLPEAVPRRDLERRVKRTRVNVSSSPCALTSQKEPLMSRAPAPAVPHLNAVAGVTNRVDNPLAEGVPAMAIQAALLPKSIIVPMPAPVVVHSMPPQHGNYNNDSISHPGNQATTQNISYMANNSAAYPISNTNNFAEGPQVSQGWPIESENSPHPLDEHTMPSFTTINESTELNGGLYQQQPVDPGPEFNIENLTTAQMGELAPLWTWHSENLDFATMPPPTQGPNGYPRPI